MADYRTGIIGLSVIFRYAARKAKIRTGFVYAVDRGEHGNRI
jgi:hypothetical protein